MALETILFAIPDQAFLSDGTTDGKIAISVPATFKVRQQVYCRSNTQQPFQVEIHRVDDTYVYVGPINTPNNTRIDVSAFTAADSAVIYALEQPRPFVPSGSPDLLTEEFEKTEHEEAPVVAKRVVLVDSGGHKIDSVVSEGLRRIAVQTQTITGGGGSGVLVAPDAANLYGSITGIAVNASGTVITVVADSLYRFAGFMARGTADARFEVRYNGITQYVMTTSVANPIVTLRLPNPDPAAAGTTVSIFVKNVGTDIGDFEATIFGFEMPSGATIETPSNANNTYGSTTAVTVGSTATVVSYVAAAGFKFRGYMIRGTADAQVSVKFGVIKKYFGTVNISYPVNTLVLPDPDATAGGTTVIVEIINTGTVTGDYEATIFGM